MRLINSFGESIVLTSFCMMACDGNIAESEVTTLYSMSEEFEELREIEIKKYVSDLVKILNDKGDAFIRKYLRDLSKTDFSANQKNVLVKVALETMKADNVVEYNEVRLFKLITKRLDLDRVIMKKQFPNDVEYFQDDILVEKLTEIPSFFKDFGNMTFALPEMD